MLSHLDNKLNIKENRKELMKKKKKDRTLREASLKEVEMQLE